MEWREGEEEGADDERERRKVQGEDDRLHDVDEQIATGVDDDEWSLGEETTSLCRDISTGSLATCTGELLETLSIK